MPDEKQEAQAPAAEAEEKLETTSQAGDSPPAEPQAETQTTEPAQEAAPAQPSEPTVSGLRDYARQYGLPVDQFEDDRKFADAALVAFLNREEVEKQKQYADRYRQHASDFERYLQERERQQPKDEKPKSLFERKPEFDPRWLQLAEQDKVTGELKPARGAPPDIVNKINAYQAWKAEAAGEIVEHFPSLIQQHVAEIVEKQFGDKFTGVQEQQRAPQLIND